MVVTKVRGLKPLPNDRGPFTATVKVWLNLSQGQSANKHNTQPVEMQILCGTDPSGRRLGNAPIVVCVVSVAPIVGFFRYFNDPVEAETVAKMVTSLGSVSESQLERLGFVEDRRGSSGN